MNAYKITLEEVDNYLKTIFSLQDELLEKKARIALLEFELALERNLVESVKKYYTRPSASSIK